jgi:hypothetical protein
MLKKKKRIDLQSMLQRVRNNEIRKDEEKLLRKEDLNLKIIIDKEVLKEIEFMKRKKDKYKVTNDDDEELLFLKQEKD